MTVLYVIAAVWLAMSLTYPFGWDQGLFAWVGRAIVNGGLPYRDAWDFKGPLVYYTFALAEWVFGAHLWGIRVLDALLLVASAVAVRRAAAPLTDAATAHWASVVYVLWYASHSYWHTAQPDGWTGMLLILAMAPLLTQPDRVRLRQLVLAGGAVGLASLLKPPAAVFLIVPLAMMAARHRPQRLLQAAVVVAGWSVPIGLAAAWFAIHGALDDLIEVHLLYSTLYASLSPGGGIRDLAGHLLTTRVVTVAAPLVVFGAVALWRVNRPAAIGLGAWALLVLSLVALQNRFYAYQWLPMLPAWTLLGAVAIHRIRSNQPILAATLTGAIVVHCVAPILLEQARFLSWLTGRTDTAAYYDAYGEPGADMRAVRWLQEQAGPGPVFVFGWHSAVPWLSERPTVSRFGYSLPLMLGDRLDVRARYRAEAMAALHATPPRYILVGAQSEQILGAQVTLRDFPELAEYVRRSYHEAARFGTLAIYERAR